MVGCALLPIINTGTILACFQSYGDWIGIDALNINVRLRDVSQLAIFSSIGGILSGPLALCDQRDIKNGICPGLECQLIECLGRDFYWV